MLKAFYRYIKACFALEIRKSVLDKVFIKSFGKFDFLKLVKSDFFNLAKINFIDLAKFAMVHRFSILLPTLSPLVSLSVS